MNCSPREINLSLLLGNLVKNVYTGIQLKKHMGVTAFADTGNPVSA